MAIIRSAIIVSVVTCVAVVAVGALTLLLGHEEIDPASGVAILRAYRLLVAAAVTASFVGLVAWLVPTIWRACAAANYGAHGLLVGLTLATLLFRKGAYWLLFAPLSRGVDIARFLFDSSTSYLGSTDSTSGADFINRIVSLTGDVLKVIIDSVHTLVSDAPFPDVLYAIATIAIPSTLLKRGRIPSWWGRLDERRRGLVGVVVTLLAGTYLCVASIIAIPWLAGDEGAAQRLTKEELRAQLAGLDTLTARTPTAISDSTDLSEALHRLRHIADRGIESFNGPRHSSGNRAQWVEYLGEVAATADRALSERRRIAEAAERRADALQKQLHEPQEQAVNSFANRASLQMTATERAVYFDRLVGWARGSTKDLLRRIDDIGRYVSLDDASITEWANYAGGRIAAGLRSIDEVGPDSAQIDPYSTVGRFFLPRRMLSEFEMSGRDSTAADVPDVPEPGLNWGPFAAVAQWLLRTKSIALAQIAGMLGFGLFGAALSALRWRERATASGTEEISFVVISGFSATLVVFLAVNGGLAVLSEGQAKPDSYVLFFACFVGAVYSQDVWSWARGKLQDSFTPGGGSRGAGGAAGEGGAGGAGNAGGTGSADGAGKKGSAGNTGGGEGAPI